MAFDNLLSVNSADVNDYGALFLRPWHATPWISSRNPQ